MPKDCWEEESSKATRTTLISALVLTSFLLSAFSPLPLDAETEEKDKSYALVMGTVVGEDGFSLPGIPVAVKVKGERKVRWHAVSDRRGEFAVRLPSGRATYEVTTESKKHLNETQSVEVYGQETVSIVFRLAAKKEAEKKQ